MLIKNFLKFLVAMQLITIAAFTAPSFANENIWVLCGKGGDDHNCMISGEADNGSVLVRYGSEDKNNYFFYGVNHQDKTPCTDFNGDPSPDDSKSCWYYRDDSFLGEGNFTRCANEGDVCNVGDGVRWVQYGAGATWLYTLQSGTIDCTDEYFGWNPHDGATNLGCYAKSEAVVPANQSWITCATELDTCNLTTINYNNAGIIIRFGANDSWIYKIATQGDSFECNREFFGSDPLEGVHKSCAFTPYEMEEIETSGEWVPKIQCSGSHCSNRFAVSTGSQWSRSITNQQTWSAGVTVSATEGIQIGPEKVETSYGFSSDYAFSTSFQKTLSDSYSETATVNCGTNDDDNDKVVIIYQFTTNSAAACLTGTGQCASTTYTQDFICYVGDFNTDDNGDFDGAETITPQCLPNACADPYCTQCLGD